MTAITTDDMQDVATLSGPRLLWAIGILAMIAMSQSARAADNYYANNNFYNDMGAARASPLFCIIQALEDGKDLFWPRLRACFGKSRNDKNAAVGEKDAEQNVALLEQGLDNSPDEKSQSPAPVPEPVSGDLVYVRSTAADRIKAICCIVVALVPAVQIFACTGIPCTQGIAGVFLAAIILRALHILRFGSRLYKASPDTEQYKTSIVDPAKTCIAQCAIVYGMVWTEMAWRLSVHVQETYEIHELYELSALWFLGGVLASAILVAFIYPCLPVRWRPGPHGLIGLHLVYGLVMLGNYIKVVPKQTEEGETSAPPEFTSSTQGFVAATASMVVCMLLPIALSLGIALTMSWSADKLVKPKENQEPQKIYDAARSEIEEQTMITWRSKRQWVNKIVEGFNAFCTFIYVGATHWCATYVFSSWIMRFRADVIWYAFLLFNWATATTYYLIAFDGKHTTAPRWSVF